MVLFTDFVYLFKYTPTVSVSLTLPLVCVCEGGGSIEEVVEFLELELQATQCEYRK